MAMYPMNTAPNYAALAGGARQMRTGGPGQQFPSGPMGGMGPDPMQQARINALRTGGPGQMNPGGIMPPHMQTGGGQPPMGGQPPPGMGPAGDVDFPPPMQTGGPGQMFPGGMRTGGPSPMNPGPLPPALGRTGGPGQQFPGGGMPPGYGGQFPPMRTGGPMPPMGGGPIPTGGQFPPMRAGGGGQFERPFGPRGPGPRY